MKQLKLQVISYAMQNNVLIGYAIALWVEAAGYGIVSWVTQLVVHTDHRNIDIGKSLLYSIFGISNHAAWGLLTANPYAIRALEKATRRRCDPIRILKDKVTLREIALTFIPYIKMDMAIEIEKEKSRIDTEFFVDHSDVNSMLQEVMKGNVPWPLGQINEGWEWFAFTFRDQTEIGLTKPEIEKMLETSDQVAQRAYEVESGSLQTASTTNFHCAQDHGSHGALGTNKGEN